MPATNGTAGAVGNFNLMVRMQVENYAENFLSDSIYLNYNAKDLLTKFFNPSSHGIDLFCGDNNQDIQVDLPNVVCFSLIISCDFGKAQLLA